MALKSNFDANNSMNSLFRQRDNLYERIINSFIRAGENFITNARGQMQDHAMGTYKDQTTNLRNSIGYFIFLNGQPVKEVGDLLINRAKVQDLIKPSGIQLIGIAGMNYASYVESKGYNVISYQADICIVDLAMYLGVVGVIDQGTAARLEETFIP